MRVVCVFYVSLLLLFAGCDSPVQSDQPKVYYDVAGFIRGQIADLSASKPLVRKNGYVGDQLYGEVHEATRAIDWNREMELFMQADINKPALRSSYAIARPDSLTYRYTLKPSEERLTVRSMLVRLDSLTGQPRQLEAVLQTNNPLYASERHLFMTVGLTQKRQWRVRHYRVIGFQKLPFFERKNFSIESWIGPLPGELGPGAPR